jgi:hypothetical protein
MGPIKSLDLHSSIPLAGRGLRSPRVGVSWSRQGSRALLHYMRPMFTEYLKKRMQDLLGNGFAMEGLALMEQIEQPK